ncbi:MAG: transposase [Melioribacteraceae bacterium]|nr:transposase [Melioribacteraceae bacterium]
MSVRSYTKIWLHLIWGTHNREKLLINKELRKKLSEFLFNYAKEKNIFIKVNYVNSDHVHSLIDLPTDKTIAEVMQLLKGVSSYWINSTSRF